MRSIYWRTAALISSLLLLSGCWDVKTMQDINYSTAVGIDYIDGKYVVYVQLLDFTNVAKQQGGGKPGQEAPVFVGTGKGKSLAEAFHDINRAAQQEMFWGHVSALVIGDKLLRKGLRAEDFDSMIRFREIRFSQWVYGTKSSIVDIFSTKSFFNLSSLSTILHQPEMNHRQSSTIIPMRYQRFIAELREPGNTVLLPSLGITRKSWKMDEKDEPLLYKDGVYALYKDHPAVYFPLEQGIGTRWVERDTDRVTLSLSVDGLPTSSLVCRNPVRAIKSEVTGGKASFRIEGHVGCRINELTGEESDELLKQQAQKEIAKEITSAFQAGKDKQSDVLRLEHVLYKQDFKAWARLTDYGKKPLADYSLKSIHWNIDLLHSGMYRKEQDGSDY
ncbi:Ger(x)C family spore germination protein [Paenibacillus sp. GD4]|jgi:spore germination protein KC|uniref:Ger(x)C family spore germination protein n=1 Tax=Paenibacillus sp. GD4 TaxID=3068890 RepID=UPI002796D66B|nr:Ger(x)C family spore germination protein [Paenibacillus sp. GD4]MDQ1910571.1 Ger(x)C family spore germination protein [Paenibacillus sp. GD4]